MHAEARQHFDDDFDQDSFRDDPYDDRYDQEMFWSVKILGKIKLKVLLNTKSVIIVVAEICAILPNNRGELLSVCFFHDFARKKSYLWNVIVVTNVL